MSTRKQGAASTWITQKQVHKLPQGLFVCLFVPSVPNVIELTEPDGPDSVAEVQDIRRTKLLSWQEFILSGFDGGGGGELCHCCIMMFACFSLEAANTEIRLALWRELAEQEKKAGSQDRAGRKDVLSLVPGHGLKNGTSQLFSVLTVRNTWASVGGVMI